MHQISQKRKWVKIVQPTNLVTIWRKIIKLESQKVIEIGQAKPQGTNTIK
jgi:hypothetical protein